MRGPLLNKPVTTKLSEQDHAKMVAAAAEAGYTSLSDWLRDAAVKAIGGATSERVDVLLEEVIALRSVMLNLLFRIGNGKTVTREEMKLIVEQSDAAKSELARARISA